MRILVSGFEPFGGESINPTSHLASSAPALAPEGADVRGVVLPVTFDHAFLRLQSEIRSFDPDVVLSFGLAGGRGKAIELERVAINCIDAFIPDNSGKQPRDLEIETDGPAGLFSTLPIRRLVEALKGSGIDAKISNTAGTYVCNYLFYRLLAANLRSRRRCGFIHVPYLPEQAAAKGHALAMTREELERALSILLSSLLAEKRS